MKLNKPIQIGMSILDLSKTLMYKFHYDYVKPKWGDRATLLFTDTDSLCYEIKTDDLISIRIFQEMFPNGMTPAITMNTIPYLARRTKK